MGIFPGACTRDPPWHTIPLAPGAVLVMEWPLSNTLPPSPTVTPGFLLQPDRSACSTPVSPAGTTWPHIVMSTPYAGPTRSGTRASDAKRTNHMPASFGCLGSRPLYSHERLARKDPGRQHRRWCEWPTERAIERMLSEHTSARNAGGV